MRLAVLLVLQLAAARKVPVHLALSVSTHTANLHLLSSSRDSWRRGIPTLVLTNGSSERKLSSPAPLEVWYEGVDRPELGWNNGAESRCVVVKGHAPRSHRLSQIREPGEAGE